MPFNNAAGVLGATAVKNGLVAGQLHSADPGADGVGFEAGSRQALDWTVPSGDGDFNLNSDELFTGLTASVAVTHISLWSQTAAGGTVYGVFPLSGDTTANISGEYLIESGDFPVNWTLS